MAIRLIGGGLSLLGESAHIYQALTMLHAVGAGAPAWSPVRRWRPATPCRGPSVNVPMAPLHVSERDRFC
jgi:hypothetical protein